MKEELNSLAQSELKLNFTKVPEKSSQDSNTKIRHSTRRSPFIKKGVFSKEHTKDEFFKLENLEYIKSDKGSKVVVGSGAFGDVFLIRNVINGKEYAIKEMDKIRIVSQGARIEFILREIDIHMRISHEHIIKLYYFFEDDKKFYLVIRN